MADHTEGTVLRAVGAESVVVRERDGCALETRCFPAPISTRWRCITCHDTTPRDRACAGSGTRERGILLTSSRSRHS